MAQRYLVVSDIHLSDIEDNPKGWKYYKSSRYLPDEALVSLIDDFLGSLAEGDEGTLVLNGDIFDFDLVTAWPRDASFKVTRGEKKRGLRPTPEKSAWKMERILDCHESVLACLVRLSAAGHRIVYVLGNHDRELHFSLVREVFLERLEAAASAAGLSFDRSELQFEPWFFYVPGKLYAEHGQQYDYYNSFRYILEPVVVRRGETELAMPMGNISNRLLMSGMGYFNPHATHYILNMFSYAVHWFRYYAFTRHNLVSSWFWGSILALSRLMGTKRRLRKPPTGYEDRLRRYGEKSALTPEQFQAIQQLQRAPITDRAFRIVREFWIDRLVMAVLMTGGTVALALVPIPLWIKLMVPLTCFPLIYFIYEAVVQGETVFSAESGVANYAKCLGKALKVPVVTFGHSHTPRILPVEPGAVFVDTGTWAPLTSAKEPWPLLSGYRNFLEVLFGEGSPLPSIRYDCHQGGSGAEKGKCEEG